ncbi:GNAT family N-acetyltransferase [Orbaceae bacterium ESL0721]|nr:GNAT family N-acetyltransferase [Orbaceae bacterium ESL0721]
MLQNLQLDEFMITYTNANLDDLPFIVEVYNSIIPSRSVTADTEPVTIESRLDWFQQHNPETRPLWLIKYDNQPAGWISLSTFYGRPAFYKTVEISLYLHANFRGKKIGQFMLNKIEKFAKSIGIETILSFIFAHNQPSIQLFTKMGYQQYGLLPKIAEIDENKYDLAILGKSLIKSSIN